MLMLTLVSFAPVVYAPEGDALMARLWTETLQALKADKVKGILADLSN
jgi:hypothetical protein